MTQQGIISGDYIMRKDADLRRLAMEESRAEKFGNFLDGLWGADRATREPSLAARLGPAGECHGYSGEAK